MGSCIFWGPPGTGKTSLANIIANSTSSHFEKLNAVSSGVADAKKIIDEATKRFLAYGQRTYLMLDECHRWNKAQSDCVLPAIEKGIITFIGSTTENPYVSMTRAIVSRCRVFEFLPLTQEDIVAGLRDALARDVVLSKQKITIDDDALSYIADTCAGDMRNAFNALELATLTTDMDKEGTIHVTKLVASQSMQRKALSVDTGMYYDMISAFIKSMRGSDPDAAVYYLARMLYAGEDIKFIARRIMICASEDVGNADPMALVVATSAAQAVERIGMPEAQIILSQAVTYVACAPKSNAAYGAISEAMSAVKNTKTAPVPVWLQDSHYKGSAKLGHGLGYKYAHDYKNHYVDQQYLPDDLKDETFYHLTEQGHEKQMKEWMDFIHKDSES